ncbi:hypothetical protein E1B28_013587 [Marasmius oreades]|uniref:Uncharacterized protein n=1 Tax=Marasmius oreades TaxID=181124 RepID=A0A9P7RQ43_9AGAR|nr:uncharacterized protein E1B28_013587 [Marasmius oreades]KAG7087639.1 hypothetical protein E1B28_013587 [Marasmius oreades]
MDITDAFEVETRPCTTSGSTSSMRLNSQISLPSVPNPLSRVQRVTTFARGLTPRVNVSRRLAKRHLRLSLSSFTTSLIRRVQHIVAFTRNLTQRVITMIKTHLRPSLLRAAIQEACTPGCKHRQPGVATEVDTSLYAVRVPTFYSGSTGEVLFTASGILQLSMAMYFGGLHCVAWNFVFPTRELCQLWRVSAITLTSIPLYYLIYVWGMQAYYEHQVLAIRRRFLWTDFRCKRLPRSVRRIFYYSGMSVIIWIVQIKFYRFGRVLQQLLKFLYLAARITLIILPFILLQDHPSRTLEEVEWTNYIPHVSWMFSQ